MEEVLISLLVGVLAAVAAYVVQGIGKTDSRILNKPKTSSEKKNQIRLEDNTNYVQQQQDHAERIIPTREWTGGKR